ncbi:HNH endonuclease, partial [Chloroflexota bacterium]
NRWLIEELKAGKNYKCEIPGCNYDPFNNSSGLPYIEAHHIIPLGKDGSESRRNIAIVCPNHHRELHYGENREGLTKILTLQKS